MWERVHVGVYRSAEHPPTWESRLLAATLALGPGAAASHRAAVGLWGLHKYRALTVEVSRPSSDDVDCSGVLAHRAPDLRPRHICLRRGVPVTRPARTLVDLGAVASPSVLRFTSPALKHEPARVAGQVARMLNTAQVA